MPHIVVPQFGFGSGRENASRVWFTGDEAGAINYIREHGGPLMRLWWPERVQAGDYVHTDRITPDRVIWPKYESHQGPTTPTKHSVYDIWKRQDNEWTHVTTATAFNWPHVAERNPIPVESAEQARVVTYRMPDEAQEFRPNRIAAVYSRRLGRWGTLQGVTK